MAASYHRKSSFSRCLLGTAALLLGACAEPDLGGDSFGPTSLVLFGGYDEEKHGVGVNSFLWRGALDTISFMLLRRADPFGGVIITDWYSPAETPRERFKVYLYILGQQLRADGVWAAVFGQRRDSNGTWHDAPVEPRTASNLENAILAAGVKSR